MRQASQVTRTWTPRTSESPTQVLYLGSVCPQVELRVIGFWQRKGSSEHAATHPRDPGKSLMAMRRARAPSSETVSCVLYLPAPRTAAYARRDHAPNRSLCCRCRLRGRVQPFHSRYPAPMAVQCQLVTVQRFLCTWISLETGGTLKGGLGTASTLGATTSRAWMALKFEVLVRAVAAMRM